MKSTFITIAISLLIGGCSTTGSNRGIQPTCDPRIGMREEVFLECACIRPLLNPDGGVVLRHTSESAYGVRKMYACARHGDNINAFFMNGILESMSTR